MHGLIDVEADGYFPVANPGAALLERATVDLLRGTLIAQGLAAPEEIDRHLANVEAGRLDLTTAPLITAWGRKR